MPKTNADFIFFWKANEKYGCFSQWAHVGFSLRTQGGANLRFPTGEHWMMWKKARLFGDEASANLILEATGPADVKALGRGVTGFDEKTWLQHRLEIVREGNLLKFRQNPKAREMLLSTGNLELVEASPRDKIWGIRFAANNAVANRKNWGENLLGKALMEVREIGFCKKLLRDFFTVIYITGVNYSVNYAVKKGK